MFLQNLRARLGARLSGDSEAGFTLIELLVVMLILGILAAIALPAFFNQKEKAGDAKAKETAHSAQVATETYATENGGLYTGVSEEILHGIEPTLPVELTEAQIAAGDEGVVVKELADSEGKGYEIIVTDSNKRKFEIVNNKGTMTYPCSPVGGGCATGGWGNG